MNNSLVCCYLTHNHPKTVQDILERSLLDYEEHGIDVCVYDDSDDEQTKEIVERYISDGAKNLYYVDAHIAKNGDDKMLYILRGYGLTREYDYIWPTKDRVCFDSRVLDELCEALDEDPDVVQLANETFRWDFDRPITTCVFQNPTEFYRRYNAFTVNWEGTIRKRSTMLLPIDWDDYYLRYKLEEEYFTQPITLFARLAELKECTIRICHFEPQERYIAPTAGGNSWRSDTFGIWIDCWIKANYKLPTLYDPYKIEGIQAQTMIYELFGSVETMMEFRRDGLYDRRIFEKYRDFWPLVSSLPISWLEMLADEKYYELCSAVLESFESAIREHDFLWALNLIITNSWFRQIYDKETYRLLRTCFMLYREDMINKGKSMVFYQINSIEDIISRYGTEN